MKSTYLLTGASGFLAKALTGVFEKAGTRLIGLAETGQDINADITRPFALEPSLPIDAVIHAAGKAHSVPRTEREAQVFFDVNFEGTKNLCAAVENLTVMPKSFIFISSVAVYGVESGYMISEDAPLLGNSPYAESKIEAEHFLNEWCLRVGIKLVVLRLPLVAGSNPPGNLGAMIKAIRKGYYFRIGAGDARRSVVLASDIARALPDIFQSEGTFNLTDGQHPSFAELDTYIAANLNRRVKVIPQSIANLMARAGDCLPGSPFNSDRLSKMSSTLTFCDRKARETFNWSPRPVIGNLEI